MAASTKSWGEAANRNFRKKSHNFSRGTAASTKSWGDDDAKEDWGRRAKTTQRKA